MSIDCLPSGATPNRQPMASVVRFGEKDPGTVWAGQPLAKNAMPRWNPVTAYFSSGEKGLIIGADDLSLLFQDSAGTIPVTAVEQHVGLVLDPSQGLELGPELVVNGAFDTNTAGWLSASGATLSVVNGAMRVAIAEGDAAAAGYQTISGATTPEKWYRFSADLVSAVNVGGIKIGITTSASGTFDILQPVDSIQVLLRVGTTITGIFKAPSGTFYVSMCPLVGGVGGGYVEIDNISVKEIKGNHSYQATSTKRPVLQARYNGLTYSEQFDNAVWLESSVISTYSQDGTLAPNGVDAATKITHPGGGISNTYQQPLLYGPKYIFSFYVKGGSITTIRAGIRGSAGDIAIFNLASGTVNLSNGVNLKNVSIILVVDGWYRCQLSSTATSNLHIFGADSVSGGYFYVWGAQLNLGTTATEYQRIAAATDYDSDITKFPWYLETDGIDDFLQTAAIDFSATDKMTVLAGIRKSSDAALAVACELSGTTASNNGSFGLQAPDGAAATYLFQSKGTSLTDAQATGVAAPITSVVTGIGSIAADSTIIRVNGVQIDVDTGDQGTGNYGNHAMYFGARAGTSAFFKGRIHYLIVRGAEMPTVDLEPGEAYVNERTGAY